MIYRIIYYLLISALFIIVNYYICSISAKLLDFKTKKDKLILLAIIITSVNLIMSIIIDIFKISSLLILLDIILLIVSVFITTIMVFKKDITRQILLTIHIFVFNITITFALMIFLSVILNKTI